MQTLSGMIAIVEDDPATRKSIKRLLQANGYTTTAFASAEEFLRSPIIDGAIGLVLDIHLGGMSGIDLRRHMSEAHSTIPVVFITAHDDEATRRRALAVGCVEILHKPFEATRLIDALERGRRQRDSGQHAGN
jgi:FixJ family two-component response regulator